MRRGNPPLGTDLYIIMGNHSEVSQGIWGAATTFDAGAIKRNNIGIKQVGGVLQAIFHEWNPHISANVWAN
jgi:hypothetical protein